MEPLAMKKDKQRTVIIIGWIYTLQFEIKAEQEEWIKEGVSEMQDPNAIEVDVDWESYMRRTCLS